MRMTMGSSVLSTHVWLRTSNLSPSDHDDIADMTESIN